MADVYEIALQGRRLSAFLSNAEAMASALKDLGELDEPEEFQEDLRDARFELAAMRRALVAQKAVIEAAVAQEEAYAKVCAADWGTVQRYDLLLESKRCASATGAAVRAMKEQTR